MHFSQEPLNAPFLKGLFSKGFSRGKRPTKAFGKQPILLEANCRFLSLVVVERVLIGDIKITSASTERQNVAKI